MGGKRSTKGRKATGAAEFNGLVAAGADLVDLKKRADIASYPFGKATGHGGGVAAARKLIEQAGQPWLVAESQKIVADGLRFAYIERDATEPPQAWVDELGQAGADRRFRLAKAAWLTKSEAPVGLDLARTIVANEQRAESHRETAPKLNVAIQMVVNQHNYAEQEVDDT